MAWMSIASGVIGLLSEAIPDGDKRAKLAAEIDTLAARNAHAERIAQIKVNEAEAKHKSIFVSGWRPFLGWAGGVGFVHDVFLYNYIVLAMESVGVDHSVMIEPQPELTISLLTGMLGITGLRTLEKVKGVARHSIRGAKDA